MPYDWPGLVPEKLGFRIGDVLVGLKSGTTDTPEAVKTTDGRLHGLSYSWNPDTLSWEVATTKGAGQGIEVYVTNQGGVSPNTVLLDAVSDTVTYVGKASPGTSVAAASWQVFRMTTTLEGDLSLEYADGNAAYDNVWDNRASLTYTT